MPAVGNEAVSDHGEVLRIAMWSGPRNISTAMMRAFENRTDTAVWDEPLYAYYLSRTGVDHPGAAEVMAANETDWRKVVARAIGPVPGGRRVFYQKHMTHHLLPEVERGWLAALRNCFLIRDPRDVLVSYVESRPNVTLEDIGLPQQVEIFEEVCERDGVTPPVLDARDVLADPQRMLSRLCGRLAVPFSERMLSWPPGPRTSDGVWARYWYASVEKSTGFAASKSRPDTLPDHLLSIAEAAEPYYRRLYRHRLV